jgi:hypothetical protein
MENSVRFPNPKLLKLTFAFLIAAVAASFAQNSSTPQNVVFSTTTYEAPAFYATFPLPDKDKGRRQVLFRGHHAEQWWKDYLA